MDCRRTRVDVIGAMEVGELQRPCGVLIAGNVPRSQRHPLVLLRDAASPCGSRSGLASLEKDWGVVFRPPPGDEVVHAFTNTLRSAAGPTEKSDRTPPQARPLCQPLAVAQSNQHGGSDPNVLKSFEKRSSKFRGALSRRPTTDSATRLWPVSYEGVTKFFNDFLIQTNSGAPTTPKDGPVIPP